MIVVLCPSFPEAIDAFYMFLKMLQEIEPWRIQYIYDACYCVEMDDNLRYIFTDYRRKGIYRNTCADYISMDEFFDLEYGLNIDYLEDYL